MKDLGTVTLEIDRLILRRITVNDAEVAFKNLTTDAFYREIRIK